MMLLDSSVCETAGLVHEEETSPDSADSPKAYTLAATLQHIFFDLLLKLQFTTGNWIGKPQRWDGQRDDL